MFLFSDKDDERETEKMEDRRFKFLVFFSWRPGHRHAAFAILFLPHFFVHPPSTLLRFFYS